MPAFSTHFLFANELKNRIQDADKSFRLNISALYYGTQGPDFMFQHRILPWMKGKSRRDIGSALHHCDPAKLFYYMGEYLNTKPCDKAVVKSYIYGFICHFSLDRITHPYVYSVQRQLTQILHAENFPSLVVHNKIELNIDAILLGEYLNKTDATAFHTDGVLLDDDNLINEIGCLMAYAIPKVINEEATAAVYIQGFKDMRYIQKLLTDGTGLLHPFLTALQLPVQPFMGKIATSFLRPKCPDRLWDYMNEAKSVWYSSAYPDIPRNESFKELMQASQDDAINIISHFDAAMCGRESFDKLTQNMDFDSGMRFDGKPIE